MRTDDFEGNDPSWLALLGTVYHAHPPATLDTENAVPSDFLRDAGRGAQTTDAGFPHLLLGIADHAADLARVIGVCCWGLCVAHATILTGRKRRAAVTVNL